MELTKFIRDRHGGSKAKAAKEIGSPKRTIEQWCFNTEHEGHKYEVMRVLDGYEVMLTKRIR